MKSYPLLIQASSPHTPDASEIAGSSPTPLKAKVVRPSSSRWAPSPPTWVTSYSRSCRLMIWSQNAESLAPMLVAEPCACSYSCAYREEVHDSMRAFYDSMRAFYCAMEEEDSKFRSTSKPRRTEIL
ncbi:hypothetical protein SETIT_7G281000v2 [Setaria italica]|uniref:Uncharacterized protein n=1 Tax=Setaria italica TaxID=4555 RepID=A0A368S0M5_SETIT|nr:hypothetical protein SETIT_7G281000v2 [Setaria italica]